MPAYFGETQRQATRDAGAIAGLQGRAHHQRADRRGARLRAPRAPPRDARGRARSRRRHVRRHGARDHRGRDRDPVVGGRRAARRRGLRRGAGEPRRGADVGAAWTTLRADPRSWARVLRGVRGGEAALDGEPRRCASRCPTCRSTATRAASMRRSRAPRPRRRGRRCSSACARPIQRALRDAGLGPRAIDEVLLVGGSTRMPCVARLAAQMFGRAPAAHAAARRGGRAWARRCRRR